MAFTSSQLRAPVRVRPKRPASLRHAARVGSEGQRPSAAGYWIAGLVAVAAIYVAVAAIIGHFLDGNGSPYLLGL